MSNSEFAVLMMWTVIVVLLVFRLWLNTKSGEKWMDNL